MTAGGDAGPQVRAALYARVSRPDERPILQNQLADLRAYIATRGLVPAGEYIDVAGGGSDDRPGLNRLMKDASRVRGRPFDLVAFTSLSRMTRGGVAAALELLRRLEAYGVGWVFTEQPILNNDAATPKLARDVILAVLAAVDEDYRSKISRATRGAYARRRALADAAGLPVVWGRRKKAPPSNTEGDPPVAESGRFPGGPP